MAENTRKDVIYNPKNAFNVIVNLYIIYKLYKVMGKLKADAFMGADFYKGVLGISRIRFGRIRNGENFIISKQERKNLSDMFNIEETYFYADGNMITVHQLDEIDWKCHFVYNYGYDFEVGLPKKLIEEKSNNVDRVLNQLVQKKLIESTYDVSEPVFRIYYYFKHNDYYRDETQLTKFTRELSKMKISDWDEILEDANLLNHYGEMLDKHSRYIQAVLTCINCRK